jgi:hypothetical protein
MAPTGRDFDSDITPYEADSITSAFALVLTLMRDLGAKGQECERTLAEAAKSLEIEEGPITGKLDAFRAFHLGYISKEKASLSDGSIQTVWASNSRLNDAFIVGQKAARLNYLAGKPMGLFGRAKAGPFANPEIQSIFARGDVGGEDRG